MTRKITRVLVLMMVVCMTLAACGGSPISMEGTKWNVTKLIGTDGEVITGEAITEALGDITYEFTADGVLNIYVNDELTSSSTYKQDGSKVHIDMDGTTVTATLSGNVMTMVNQGVKIEYTKQ